MPNEELNQVPSQPQLQPQPTELNPNFYDPNIASTPAAPLDYTGLQTPEAPYSAPGQGAYQNSYADYTQTAPGYTDPAQQTYGDYTQQPETISSSEVFEEKKSGNKMVLYGAIGVLVLLVIAAGVLIYLNFFTGASTSTPTPTNNTSQTNNTPAKTDTKPATPTINTSLTGGPNTPATKARVFNESKTPSAWLKQKFTAAVIDADGNCIVANVCGDSADSDNDGLSVIEEYNFQTDPQNADTDNDGISDGDEVFVYNSDPLKADTDTDTYKDGAEIVGCFDPNVNETPKMNQTRLAEISTQIGLRPLKEKTKTTLTTGAATPTDIASKGVVSAACGPATSTTTTPNSGTTTPTPNTTSPAPTTNTNPTPSGN
jgi:hypothetical protein